MEISPKQNFPESVKVDSVEDLEKKIELNRGLYHDMVQKINKAKEDGDSETRIENLQKAKRVLLGRIELHTEKLKEMGVQITNESFEEEDKLAA